MKDLEHTAIEIRTAFSKIRSNPLGAEQHLINALTCIEDIIESEYDNLEKIFTDTTAVRLNFWNEVKE